MAFFGLLSLQILVTRQFAHVCHSINAELGVKENHVVRNWSSSWTQFLSRMPRQLRNGCGGTFWPSSAPRIGSWEMKISNPWTINCGLFWRTWHAECVTTAWKA